MSLSILRTVTVAVVALLLSTTLAGCFASTDKAADDGTPAYHISRTYSLILTPDRMDSFQGADDPEKALRDLFETSLVIRVGDPGTYLLSYTDSAGRAQERQLTGMTPGAPVVITNVDPLGAAILKQDNVIKAERAVKTFSGFQLGDIPLGFWLSEGANTVYDYRVNSQSEFALTGVSFGEGDEKVNIREIAGRMNLPFKGTVSWAQGVADSAGSRLDVSGAFTSAAPTSGSVLSLTAAGTANGEAFEGGFEIPQLGLALDGGASFWVKSDQVVAARMNAATFSFDPTVYAWGYGPDMGDALGVCEGKTRADRCTPEGIERMEHETPAGQKETLDTEMFKVKDGGDRKLLEFMEKLLAQDIAIGDKLTVGIQMDSQSLGEKGDARFGYSLEMAVPAKEQITVPAGSFDALRITQTMRVVVDAKSIHNNDYDYSTGRSTDREVVRGLDLNETVTRTTIWLDAKTFQPLKVTTDSPMDLNDVLRRVLRSITDDGWKDSPVGRITENNVRWSANGEAVLEARSISGNARFAPQMGLILASALSSGAGFAVAPLAMIASADPSFSEPAYAPSKSLSLTSASALSDGHKRYTVASATPGMTWYDIDLTVNGMDIDMKLVEDCNATPPAQGWFACRGDDGRGFIDPIQAGDQIRLYGVGSGDTLRVVDSYADAVILTLTIS